MTKIINTINDFNEENIKKIKEMIDSKNITDIESLDKIIDIESINKNNNGIKINELSVYSDEFKKYKRSSTNELNKLLNDVLPKVCIKPDGTKTDVKPIDINEFIGLLSNKLESLVDIQINQEKVN